MSDGDLTTTQADDPPTEPITLPAADTATEQAPVPPPDKEYVTCPECGTGATVTLNRRLSEDFCRRCDFPLFWTPSEVVLGGDNVGDDSLRRLPGTTGRAMTASVACPHCAELNPVTAVNCVRCGLPMQVREAAPPPPEPVAAPSPPAPVYVPEPQRIPWWVWLAAAVIVTTLTVLVVLAATGTIA